jgi:tetratricopeptide (TPR) repeat protein
LSSRENSRGLGALTGSLYRRLVAFAQVFKAARGQREPESLKKEGSLVTRLLMKGATTLTVITIVVVATALLSDLFAGNRVVIKSFLVSSELQGKLNDEMIANLLRHDISIMVREAKSVKKSHGFDVPLMTTLPDVQVPASSLSVKTFLRYVQAFPPLRYIERLLGLRSTEVNGEARLEGDWVKISLRITKDPPDDLPKEAKTFTASLSNIEPAIAEASEYILAYAEPYLWAAYLYEKKQPDRALGQVQYCMLKDPAENRRMALILWGLILMDEGKYDEAIARFEEATKDAAAGHERERELAVAYNNWGLALLYECKVAEAIPKFDESIRHDPNFALTYNNYGKAFMDSGKKDEAVAKLEQALNLDPDLATAYFNLGIILANDKPEKAVAKFMAAIHKDENYVEAYNGLGQVLVDNFASTRNGEAFDRLNKAIGLDKEFAPAYINRALAWANEGNFKKAIEDGEKAVNLYPKMPKDRQGCADFNERYSRAYNNLGWFYEEDKQYEPAAANYQRAVDLDPKYHLAYKGKADALRKWGGAHIKEALTIYEWLLQVPEASRNISFSAYKSEGEILLERSRSRGPAERRADLEKSISVFEEALKLKPADEDVTADLAKAKAALGLLRSN